MKNNEGKRRKTLMQLQFSLPKKIIFSVLAMAVLIAFVYFFNVPNPNMILIAGLVLCSALFGFGGGITAGVIMFFYTLYFFSTDNSFIHFTEQNTQKVIVSLVGILADLLLVCFLKRAEVQAFEEVDELTAMLHEENTRLQSISITDALTGVRNRMALRREFESYENSEVTVIMLDIDRFKMINDTHGHKEGDRVLRETGAALSEVFGKEDCYRYGGDEFLVICQDASEEEINKKLDSLKDLRPVIEESGKKTCVDFSYGYSRGKVDSLEKLREMLAEADEYMYEVKNKKKSALFQPE